MNNKLVEHDIKINEMEKDLQNVNKDLQHLKDKHAHLDGTQKVILEKVKDTEEDKKSKDKFVFWLITSGAGALIAHLLKK